MSVSQDTRENKQRLLPKGKARDRSLFLRSMSKIIFEIANEENDVASHHAYRLLLLLLKLMFHCTIFMNEEHFDKNIYCKLEDLLKCAAVAKGPSSANPAIS